MKFPDQRTAGIPAENSWRGWLCGMNVSRHKYLPNLTLSNVTYV